MNRRFLSGLFVLLALSASLSAATVSTVIPSGIQEPTGVAIDASQNIYITDAANNRVMKRDSQNGLVSTFAGSATGVIGSADGVGTQARFFNPQGLIVGRNGLLVADEGNQVIRTISLQGQVTTIAGTAGSIGLVDGMGAAARFNFPQALTIDSEGVIYVADTRNNAIRKIEPNNNVTTIVTGVTEPAAIVRGDGNDLWVATLNKIVRFDTNGVTEATFGSTTAGSFDGLDAVDSTFNLPNGLLWLGANSGGLIISDTANHTIRRIFPSASAASGFTSSTIAGTAGMSGSADGDALTTARFHFPIGLANDPLNGGFLVADFVNSSVRRVQQGQPLPKITNPQIGIAYIDNKGDVAFDQVIDRVFNEVPLMAILAETGVQTFYSSGRFPSLFGAQNPDPGPDNVNPGAGSAPAFNLDFGGLPEQLLDEANLFPDLEIKAISTQSGRIPSDQTSARFQFIVSTPQIVGNNAGDFKVTTLTTDTTLFYTTNGSDPTNQVSDTTFLAMPGTSISLQQGNTNILFKVRAFRDNFQPSPIASKLFETNNFDANKISFGFGSGEGSSKFVGAAGQTFSAPVTLSLLGAPEVSGLQFNLKASATAPAPPITPGAVTFVSHLLRQNPDLSFTTIPPQMFLERQTQIQVTSVMVLVGNNLVPTNITNTVEVNVFTNLLATNFSQNLLSVGWLEIPGTGANYDDTRQKLLTFSQAHATLFNPANNGGKVLVGSFHVTIPGGASTGQKYPISIGRPSAVAGLQQDVFLLAPTNGSLGAGIALNSLKEITIGDPAAFEPGYVVGDCMPFRWFNAGDFGDTNLLANDALQVLNAAVFNLNVPSSSTDFYDSMDSSNAKNNPGLMAQDGNDVAIDAITMGDGELNVDDIFVTWRRALDPTRVWYRRFWLGDGTLKAVQVPNQYRGGTGIAPAGAAPAISTAEVNLAEVAADFRVEDAVASGSTVSIPVRVNIHGGLPIKSLMLGLEVTPLGGSPEITQPVTFSPSPGLGVAFGESRNGANTYAGVWLPSGAAGISGENALVGTLTVTLPAGAPVTSAYVVSFKHVSASPNGLGLFPTTTENGLVTLMDRSISTLNDGISDAWRLKNFGAINSAIAQGNVDVDFDGVTNAEEFMAGTDPNDSSSNLHLLNPTPVRDGSGAQTGVAVSWATVRLKSYVIECADSLTSTWNVIHGPVTGTGHDMSYLHNTSGSSTHLFYRVRLVETSGDL